MKIGIAVEKDNKTITVRTGHAPSFAVFTLQADQIIEEGVSPMNMQIIIMSMMIISTQEMTRMRFKNIVTHWVS